MKYLKCTILLFVFLNSKTFSQKLYPFAIKIDTSHFSFDDLVPSITMLNPLTDRIFEDIEFPTKKGVYPFQSSVNISKPVFFKIVNVPILGIPNQTLKGLLDNEGNKLVVYDSSDVNNFLLNANDSLLQFWMYYGQNVNSPDYNRKVDSLNKFISYRIEYLKSNEALERYKLTKEIQSASIEYFKINLALHIIYPLNFNDRKRYVEDFVNKNVKITYPDYWIQLGAGRAFLSTYFFKTLLSKYKNDFDKIFETEPLFKYNQIRRYIGYQYFTSMLKNDSTFLDYMSIVKKIDAFKKKYDCDRDEIKMFDKIREQFLRKGNDITDLFNKQDLVNYSGNEVKEEKWSMLKDQGKIFVYYWASWCIPCLETMHKLKNTTATYEEKQYKVIFISIDKRQEQWQKVKKSILSPTNSYRLANVSKKSFYTVFQITSVPRLFLIEDGKILETNYPKIKFEKIFGE